MLIVGKEKYSSNIPFETLVRAHCTKSAMRPLVDLFVLPVKKSAGKDEFLEDVAMSIQIYPQWWMALLPQYELQLLKQILEQPRRSDCLSVESDAWTVHRRIVCDRGIPLSGQS